MTFRNLANDCNCQTGYYNQDIMDVNTCSICPEQFSSCNSPTDPTGCKGSNRKNLSNDCECLDNYFEDPTTDGCITC